MSFGGGGGFGSSGFGSTVHGASAVIRYLIRYTYNLYVTLKVKTASYLVKRFKAKVHL